MIFLGFSSFTGAVTSHAGLKDLTWLRPDGTEMTQAAWDAGDTHVLGMLVNGRATDETDDRGRPIEGDTMLLLVNGSADAVTFTPPALEEDGVAGWTVLVDTAAGAPGTVEGDTVEVAPYALLLLRHGQERRMPVFGG